MPGIWASTILVTLWIALGSWVAVFPDTLEKVFGVGYGFKGSWGVTQGEFELLTLGTLAVILVFALIGYWAGRDVRAQTATIELPVDVATAGGTVGV
jgi:hypothetical protein